MLVRVRRWKNKRRSYDITYVLYACRSFTGILKSKWCWGVTMENAFTPLGSDPGSAENQSLLWNMVVRTLPQDSCREVVAGTRAKINTSLKCRWARTATGNVPKSALRPAFGQPKGRFRFFPGSSPAKNRPGRPIYRPTIFGGPGAPISGRFWGFPRSGPA